MRTTSAYFFANNSRSPKERTVIKRALKEEHTRIFYGHTPQTMILYTACILSAVLWLSFRLYRLLSIPLPKIISSLRLTTPPAIKASIDKITSDSITIHWENEADNDKVLSRISHFVLYLDNIQIATFPNSSDAPYICCMITQLKPQQQYQLDFITVNELGFTNRLPSLYCMTKMEVAEVSGPEDSPDSLNQPPVDLNSPHIPGDNIPGSPVMAKTRKWRRNTLSSVNQVDAGSIDAQTAASQVPSYTNLTKLEDLEKFTIDDLKKILICSQEDLHDVLAQQTTAIQDFQENKLSLELELENLKTQLSHEMEFKKSVKSNIKSLESAKLLSDLKYDKANEKIEHIEKKIEKMKNDMKTWEQEEKDSMDRKKLTGEYENLIKEEEEKTVELTDNIKILQQNIAKQESENKKLNNMKKSSSSTNLKDHMANGQSQVTQNVNDNLQQTLKLLKKVDECISDKSGLLNTSGEHYLSKLNSNSPAVKLVKEQLKIDEDREHVWKGKRMKLIKRIKNLDAKFANVSVENGQLKANLFARTYQQPIGSPSDIAPVISASSYNSSGMNGVFSNSDVNVTPSESNSGNTNQYASGNQAQTSNPLLSAFNVPSQLDTINTKPSVDYPSKDDIGGGNSISPRLNRVPLVKSLSGTTQSAMDSGDSIYPVSSFSRGIPTTATTDAIAAPSFPWGSSDQQLSSVQNSQVKSSISNDFAYDNNNNHLITGLENMIYDENDNADKVSNYSKAYTTDQLDSFWSNQKDTSNGSILPQRYNSDNIGANTSNSSLGMAFNSDFTPINHPVPAYANDMTMPLSSSPLATNVSAVVNHTPNNSISMMQPQSLLVATLNDQNAMSPFPDTMQMSQPESAFRNTLGTTNTGMDAFMSSRLPLSPSASQSLSGIAPDANMLNFNNQVQQHFSSAQGLSNPAKPLDVTAVTGTPLSMAKPDDEIIKGHASRNSHDMFHSPSFNFIWQTTTSPSKSSGKMNNNVPNLFSSPTKTETTKEHTFSSPSKSKRTDSNATHKRDKSSGSISSWGNRLSLKSRQSVASTVVEDGQSGDDHSVNSGAQESTHSSNKKTGSGSSSRRISRLLSKSGMNNLFNLQGHDAQPTTPSTPS